MKKDENFSERRDTRMKFEKTQQSQSEDAGDPKIPEGMPTETRKNYSKLLRKDYQFNQDVNAREADDVILQSGCNEITDAI